jgi:transposase-like protein
MEIFEGRNLIEFSAKYKTELDCKKYLSDLKWDLGYECKKCKNTSYQERKDYSRTCNKCSHTESPGANTLFHKVKFGLRKAFFICFEMATSTKSLSAKYTAVRYGITEKTARLFMHKIREAMKSSENYPMEGKVEVDEFVVGGFETGKIGRSYDSNKKKAVCAVEFTEKGAVKRMYIKQIDNYSANELKPIFDKHISSSAEIFTDKWKGYRPLQSTYNITQIESEGGLAFKKLHIMIHQVKSWIRTTYSWISKKHAQRYFDEFCYRLNRSNSRNTVFNNLIKRMVVHDKQFQVQIVCS